MLKIKLLGVYPIAYLEGATAGSNIVESGGHHFLKGEFTLHAFGYTSQPIEFNSLDSKGARVEERGDNWVLVKLSAFTRFDFGQREWFEPANGDGSVRGGFRFIELQQRTAPQSLALLSFIDISASLMPDDFKAGEQTLTYPANNGPSQEELRGLPWEGQTDTAGFYLKRNVDGEFEISLGSLRSQVKLDFLDEFQVRISSGAEIFLAPQPDKTGTVNPKLTILPLYIGRTAARVILSEQNDGNIRFAKNPKDKSSRKLVANRFLAVGKTFNLDRFRNSYLDVRHENTVTNGIDKLGATRIYGPQERFSFTVELPPIANLKTARARINYRDVLPFTGGRTHHDRFYSVRIRGLGDVRGNQPALDTDLAVFELSQTERTFALKAGGDLDIDGVKVPSQLQPKLDPRQKSHRLDIPIEDVVLRVDASNSGDNSPMEVDTEGEGKLILSGAEIVAAPLGISAVDGNTYGEQPYAEWTLKNKDEKVVLKLTAKGLGIPEPKVDSKLIGDGISWLENFETKNPEKEYRAVQQTELKLKIDLGDSGSINYKATKIKKVKDATNKEKLAYSTFFATLTYGIIELINARVNKTWKVIGDEKLDIGIEKLDDGSSKFIKRNGLKDLIVAYDLTEPGHKEGFKSFVELNRPKEKHDRLLLPVSKVVGIVLWKEGKQGKGLWADDIAEQILGKQANTSLAFDFSSVDRLEPEDVGWEAGKRWQDIAKDAKPLWPKGRSDGAGSAKEGARLDPSDPAWRGIFVHDVPASVILSPEVLGSITGKAPLIKRLLELLTESLFVEYAWRDEHGASFSGGLVSPEKLTPASWDNVLEIIVTGLKLKGAPLDGASSGIVQADGSVEIKFPWWTQNGKPLVAEGAFQLDLTKKDPVKSFKVRLTQAYSGKPNIPGIKEMRLIDWEFDLKTLKLVVGIKGDEKLAKVLPFLDDKEIVGSVHFNLEGKPENKFSLILPTDIETKLFGKWNFEVSAIAFARKVINGKSEFLTRFRGSLDLGLPVLSSAGAYVTVSKISDKDWGLDVELQELGINLEVGDMSLAGTASWERLPEKSEAGSGEDPGPEGRVRSDLVARAGREREFYAFLTAQGGLFGTGWYLAAKSGNTGGITYWIGAVKADTSINLGSMQLREPALLLAHNADNAGKLKKSFSDVTAVIQGVLRPNGKDEEEMRKWLKDWKPSTDIGTLVAASGYLEAHSQVAKAPNAGDDNLTSIAYSDQGMFRVDAKTLILGGLKARFAMTIDTREKYIEAGFQLPKVSYPAGVKDPQYEVSPGFLVLGVGYGTKKRLKMSIGWPEAIGEDGYERDWSKATIVKVADMYPINTFWGGVKAELTGDFIYLGFAIRAGWTRSYEVNGANIAKASAELGVAIGGVFEFKIIWDETSGAMVPQIDLVPTKLTLAAYESMWRSSLVLKQWGAVTNRKRPASSQALRIKASLQIMEASAARLTSLEVRLAATIYADLWGSASIEFLGVTIAAISVRAYARFKVCGSSTRGILVMKAAMGFEVSITILCVTYETTARIDVILRDEGCGFGVHDSTDRLAALPPELMSLDHE